MDILKGIVTALTASFLVALLFAYTFRLPIPMGGMVGPLGSVSTYTLGLGDVLHTVFFAWVFYGLLGGFVIVPISGALAGYWAGQTFAGRQGKNAMILLFSALASAIPVTVLATLDYIIGPW